MEDSKIKILVLEDDSTLGEALKEAFTRVGHQVFLVTEPEKATEVINKEKIDMLFIDCLLPQIMGIDYVTKIRQEMPSKTRFKVVLMSGIYTDKDFIQDATKKTQAVGFLRKPFDLNEALKLVKVDESNRKEEASPRRSLYQIFGRNMVSNREKRKLIEALEEVSGFDLPFVYSLLVETKSSGHLNIYGVDGNVSGVSLSNGVIVGVDIEDKTTYLGEMLIQSGYAIVEDVQEALNDKSPRRLGQRMIQGNKLSPHAFDLILTEQMNIRLSRTIVDQMIRINFASVEVEMIEPSIDSDSLSYFLHDWIASKLSANWLKSMHMMWASYRITRSSTYREDHPALKMSLIQSLEGFTDHLDRGVTLMDLLGQPGYHEAAVHKAIHFLLTKGLIAFSKSQVVVSPQEQLKTLRKIFTEIQGKNHFQVVEYFGLGQETVASVSGMVEEFLPVLGAQPKDPKSEAYKLWTQIRQRVTEACTSYLDAGQRQQYKQNNMKSEAENKLRATSLLEEAKKALELNQYSKAMNFMNQVVELNPAIAQVHLYNAWAKVGTLDPAKKIQQLKDIEFELMQVPPDERYDAIFPFVTGLVQKAKGDISGARKSFEKCLALSSSMIVARRELNLLASGSNKQDDILNMDLKKMVSGFFKKK
ncbi:response regulator [Bdellovibrio sp. HCB337]|uniref:response regulator n=1 Tax=Bdellovibrio sp. HCB337 TaxID=3394358 RepID=UPI0039A72505